MPYFSPRGEPSFRLLRNLSIQSKSLVASVILLACLLGLAATAYVALDRSAARLQTLSGETLPKRLAFRELNDAIVYAHLKTFRYVSWASNGVSDKLLTALRHEVDDDFTSIAAALGVLAERTDLS